MSKYLINYKEIYYSTTYDKKDDNPLYTNIIGLILKALDSYQYIINKKKYYESNNFLIHAGNILPVNVHTSISHSKKKHTLSITIKLISNTIVDQQTTIRTHIINYKSKKNINKFFILNKILNDQNKLTQYIYISNQN